MRHDNWNTTQAFLRSLRLAGLQNNATAIPALLSVTVCEMLEGVLWYSSPLSSKHGLGTLHTT